MSSSGSKKLSLLVAIGSLLVALACLTVASPAAASPAASKQSGSWTDAATWVSGRVPANDDLVAIIGHVVTIPSGKVVTSSGVIQVEKGALVNDGTLNTSGRLTILFESIGSRNNGTLVSTGTMKLDSADFTNAGTMSIEQSLTHMANRRAARFVNTATGVLTNRGKLDTQAGFQNDGKFVNAGQFTFANPFGAINFFGGGAVVNEASGRFTIAGNLAGNGPFVNAGILEISVVDPNRQEGFWVRNTLENRGTIRMGFLLRVEPSGVLTNTKEGTITSAGSRLVNFGRVENHGSIVGGECAQCAVVNGGTFNNHCGATAVRVNQTAPISVPCGNVATAASMLASPAPAAATPAPPPTAFGTTTCSSVRGTTLPSGGAMKPGTVFLSPGGKYELAYQTDGNLVVYERSPRTALWSSRTNGIAALELVMQPDGNVVARKPDSSAAWSSNTAGNTGAVLSLQDDGNLVVYRKDSCQAVWARR